MINIKNSGAFGEAPTARNNTTRNNIPFSLINLSQLMEARGLLRSVEDDNGQCIAVFEFGNVGFPAEMAARLTPFVGRSIAVLRLDDEFYIRDVD